MRLKLALAGTSVAVLAAAVGVAASSGGRASAAGAYKSPSANCASLASAALGNAKVTSAEPVAAGRFTPPGAAEAIAVPAFCRVAATLTPSSDSDIKVEVWLPQAWNGKFMAVGNGGWNGTITYAALGVALSRGYAAASTDTGHTGPRGTFAYQHPEKLTDFAWRAVHETAVKGKALTAAYYGQAPALSYWNGCSSGGKQGLKEIQQFPADFDGVIAGAPANNWVRLQTQSLVANLANLPKGGQPILGQAQFAILNKGVLDQCDAADGLTDRQVLDPRSCAFKATSLICKPGQAAGECLTSQQAEVADKIYAPVKNPRTGQLIFPGMPPGSEMSWAAVVSRPWDTGVDTYRYAAFNNPEWDFYTLDLATDVDRAEKADVGIMATTPDLSAFKARGGKLIQYHGWADPLIPTENSINYYESVVARQGGLAQAQEFHRLFLVPGMGHCNGAYTVDWITALEQWVEGGRAPERVIAKRIPPAGQSAAAAPPPGGGLPAPAYGERPMCAYPEVARYRGAGSGEEPVNFTCGPGERGSRPGQGPARMGDQIASK